jgi:protein-S-isoprenylcysteine O-methyltransferase Ste14
MPLLRIWLRSRSPLLIPGQRGRSATTNVGIHARLPRPIRQCPRQCPPMPSMMPMRQGRCMASASPAEPSGGRQSEDEFEAPDPVIFGAKLRLEDVVHYINIIYFGVLLASIFTGNRQLTNIAAITNLINAMFLASAAFTGWSATRWIQDVRQHITTTQRQKDLKALLRYGWSALFWAGFVLWYAVPPLEILTQWTGTAGAICCLYGITLAVFSALMVGTWSFLGEPSTPRRLVTGGPYALLRHPQALGNFLALIGFSLSGGAITAALAFATSFALYAVTVVPREEKLLEQAFGAKYRHYAERVPPFSWALILLLIVEALLIWRYGLSPGVEVSWSWRPTVA